MRVFFSGPRILGIRTGISLGPEDLRRIARPSTQAVPSAFVYVVESAAGCVKIGFTNDPIRNLGSLQRGSAARLRLAYVCAAKSNHGAMVEAAAHDILHAYRQTGEWFNVSAEMAVAAISTASFRINDPVVQIPIDRIGEVITLAASPAAVRRPKTGLVLALIAAGITPLIALIAASGAIEKPSDVAAVAAGLVIACTVAFFFFRSIL